MKRFRISIREMLLITALLAVVLAYAAVRLEMRRVGMRGELKGMELWREFTSGHSEHYTSNAAWRSDLQQLDANIAERKKALGQVGEHR